MPPVKPRYQTIAGRDDDDNNNFVGDDGSLSKPIEVAATTTTTPPSTTTTNVMEVIILDFTHTRFVVPLASGLGATVGDLKLAGARFHAVAANQQRLIYQGKLLSDDAVSMQQCGIRHGSIVHLFPKPRVVVTNSSNNNTNNADAAASNSVDAAPGDQQSRPEHNYHGTTGRVPTIIIDEAERAQRGQILVLGSVDYMEAVNNVKLFSFMLLVISTIELLNLIAVALGEGGTTTTTMGGGDTGSGLTPNDAFPYTEHDDFFPRDDDTPTPTMPNDNSSGGNGAMDDQHNATNSFINPYQTWSSLSWIDLVVSVLGIYVALLGIRASNENALSIARLYLYGTAVTAIGWLVYNFIINFEIDEMEREQIDQQRGGGGDGGNGDNSPHHNHHSPMDDESMTDDSVFNQAVQAMVVPAVVWGLCIFRAWQFQHILAEAEQDAIERIHTSELESDDDADEEQQALQNQSSSSSSSPLPSPQSSPAVVAPVLPTIS